MTPAVQWFLSDKDFEQVEIKSRQTIEILEFAKLEEVDPMFFDQPSYLVPDKNGTKACLRSSLRVGRLCSN